MKDRIIKEVSEGTDQLCVAYLLQLANFIGTAGRSSLLGHFEWPISENLKTVLIQVTRQSL